MDLSDMYLIDAVQSYKDKDVLHLSVIPVNSLYNFFCRKLEDTSNYDEKPRFDMKTGIVYCSPLRSSPPSMSIDMYLAAQSEAYRELVSSDGTVKALLTAFCSRHPSFGIDMFRVRYPKLFPVA